MLIPTGLKCLVQEQDVIGIKYYLESLPAREKGSVFESILTELYRGNGWLVKRQGGRGDAGADILLYHPKTPSTVSIIIQAKNHSLPLTFDQTRLELIKFEEQSATLHKCQNFRLVAVNGFVREAEKLGRFNLLLDGWEHIEKLIATYDPQSIAEPTIELFAHNRITYNRINELWKDSRHVAVVQATGTGKSYLIAKVLADFLDKRKLVLAPSTYILDQQKSKIPWLSANTDYLTYAKLFRMTRNEIAELNYGLIVLDEFHRCGADVWGKGVQRLLDSHPDAKVLGTTATPIRYLDDSRDMAEEMFDGIVAEDLSLAEAIVRRILPPPIYISALYTLNEEYALLLDDIEASKRSEEEKTELKQEVNFIKLNWEKTSGVPEILKKHLPSDINKLIVFCKDQQHLDEMEIEVLRWFLKAGTHQRRKTYRILSADPDSYRNLEDFKNASGKETVHLLFAIDMLNEGLHIPEVGAVLLLRPTESPIIFYQQIGRCIQVGKDQAPIIFDLVNNFQNVRSNDFLSDLEAAKVDESTFRGSLGLSIYEPSIKFEELTNPIEAIFESIRERLVSWKVMFEMLVEFKDKYGHCNVSRWDANNSTLGMWASNQRTKKQKGNLLDDRIACLDSIGFEWNLRDFLWDKMLSALFNYKAKNGNCNVPRNYDEYQGLSLWVGTQRHLYNIGKLPKSRYKILNDMGFVWDTREDRWDHMYRSLVEFHLSNGDSNVPSTFHNQKLSKWVNQQRVSYRKNMLSKVRTDRLNEIGFQWDLRSTSWNNMFAKLCEYKKRFGNCSVPQDWDENPLLGKWVSKTRRRHSSLNDDQLNKLNEIGFVWSTLSDNTDEMLKALHDFKSKFGHCAVPQTFPENQKLATWVGTRRGAYKRNKLNSDLITQLNTIGFIWDAREGKWEHMYQLLVEYRNANGHCNVPQKCADNKQLATWVNEQRLAMKSNKMSEDRKRRLDSIGFKWIFRRTHHK